MAVFYLNVITPTVVVTTKIVNEQSVTETETFTHVNSMPHSTMPLEMARATAKFILDSNPDALSVQIVGEDGIVTETIER